MSVLAEVGIGRCSLANSAILTFCPSFDYSQEEYLTISITRASPSAVLPGTAMHGITLLIAAMAPACLAAQVPSHPTSRAVALSTEVIAERAIPATLTIITFGDH